jgi:hypothetical protein
MVFLASHAACSGLPSLQYSLLRILNSPYVDSPTAIKLRAQSLETFLEQCKETEFITDLVEQEKQLDSSEMKALLVAIVGPGAGASQIRILLDLVRGQGLLANAACQQLSVVFSGTEQASQLSIARLLIGQLDTVHPGFPQPLISGPCKSRFIDAGHYFPHDTGDPLAPRRRENRD